MSDVIYVDELIGPDTVNTVPPATLDAFRDHGRARTTLTGGMAEADATMKALVKDAVAVVIEPQHLDAIPSLASEHEEGAALGIEPLTHREREGVERTAHVLSLRAHEDADCRRDDRCRA